MCVWFWARTFYVRLLLSHSVASACSITSLTHATFGFSLCIFLTKQCADVITIHFDFCCCCRCRFIFGECERGYARRTPHTHTSATISFIFRPLQCTGSYNTRIFLLCFCSLRHMGLNLLLLLLPLFLWYMKKPYRMHECTQGVAWAFMAHTFPLKCETWIMPCVPFRWTVGEKQDGQKMSRNKMTWGVSMAIRTYCVWVSECNAYMKSLATLPHHVTPLNNESQLKTIKCIDLIILFYFYFYFNFYVQCRITTTHPVILVIILSVVDFLTIHRRYNVYVHRRHEPNCQWNI